MGRKSNLKKHLEKAAKCEFCNWKQELTGKSLKEIEDSKGSHLRQNHKDKIEAFKL